MRLVLVCLIASLLALSAGSSASWAAPPEGQGTDESPEPVPLPPCPPVRDPPFDFPCFVPPPRERPENPPCLALTLSLCISDPSDYVLRVRNLSPDAVSVVPWDGAPASIVAPGADEIVSSSGYPDPPWRIVVEDVESGRVLYERVIQGRWEEFGPSIPPFAEVWWFAVMIWSDGSVQSCPGACFLQ